MGTAPAFGGALAQWDGSDLLSLRLPFTLQWGDAVLRTAPLLRSSRVLPDSLDLLRSRFVFALIALLWAKPFDGLLPSET